MPKTDAERRAQRKYLAGRGRVQIYTEPAEAAAIRAAAAAAGETVKAYVLGAVRARMAAEGVKGSDDGDGPPI